MAAPYDWDGKDRNLQEVVATNLMGEAKFPISQPRGGEGTEPFNYAIVASELMKHIGNSQQFYAAFKLAFSKTAQGAAIGGGVPSLLADGEIDPIFGAAKSFNELFPNLNNGNITADAGDVYYKKAARYALTSASITTAGTGYVAGDEATVATDADAGQNAVIKITSVSDGVPTAVSIINHGLFMNPMVGNKETSGGSGTGLVLGVESGLFMLDKALDGIVKNLVDLIAKEIMRVDGLIAEEVARATGVEGSLEDLTTSVKTSLVAAINEVQGEINEQAQNIITLSNTLTEAIADEAQAREAGDDSTLSDSKAYTDEKIAAFETNGRDMGGWWFGKTTADFEAPMPESAAQNCFDFTTNTPYTAKEDLSGWDAGTPLELQDGDYVNITSHFWDLAEGQLSGKAIYSELEGWAYYPNYSMALDGDTLVNRESDGAAMVGAQDFAITEDTDKFTSAAPLSFKAFWQGVLNKINGLIQAVAGKQAALNRTVRTNLASTSAITDTGGNITPGVTGTLPIANGGTGATTAAEALTNLGIAPIKKRYQHNLVWNFVTDTILFAMTMRIFTSSSTPLTTIPLVNAALNTLGNTSLTSMVTVSGIRGSYDGSNAPPMRNIIGAYRNASTSIGLFLVDITTGVASVEGFSVSSATPTDFVIDLCA